MAEVNTTVNMDNVPKRVQKDVDAIRSLEDKKSNITDLEFSKLSEYLAKNIANLNSDSVDYINGFMIEYQEKKAKEFEENEVTKATKNRVQDIKEMVGKKGKQATIDQPVEAKALLDVLKDPHADLNPADRLFIQSVLIKSGYGYLLYQDERPVQIVNVTVIQAPEKEKEEEKTSTDAEKNTETKPVKNTESKKTVTKKAAKPKPKETTEETKKDETISGPSDGVPNTSTPSDSSKSEPTNPAPVVGTPVTTPEQIKKAKKVLESERTEGFGIADKIQEELHDRLTNKTTVREECMKVSRRNAFSFVGKMMQITDSKTVFGDLQGKITYREAIHVARCLLNQATDMNIGMENNLAFTRLKEEVNKLASRDQNEKPNKEELSRLSDAFRYLYHEESKVYDTD